jgi:hypothetical protein
MLVVDAPTGSIGSSVALRRFPEGCPRIHAPGNRAGMTHTLISNVACFARGRIMPVAKDNVVDRIDQHSPGKGDKQ